MKKKELKALLRKKLWRLTVLRKLVLNKKSYLNATGWIESVKRGYPCGPAGSAIPWMNYPVVDLLRERLHKDLRLFEYGSGYSTVFYASLVRDVVSIEYNKSWFDHVAKTAPDNVQLVFKEKDIDGKYCRAISEHERQFDVVIVDGRDRVNCAKQSLERLSASGVVILDDSYRDRYAPAFEHLHSKGFRSLSIAGLKPGGFGTDRTTIFYRDNNCLGL